MKNNLLVDLQQRGILKDITDDSLHDFLNTEQQTIYCGFDPTGDSLHLGNLVSLITLKRFQKAGHRVIAVIGGATARIGDPSGRDKERALFNEKTLEENTQGIAADIRRVLDFESTTPALLLNNKDWVGNLNLIDFLRDIGKHFRVNTMINMTSVRDRLARAEGISFTEFSYSLIQAFDFMQLARTEGCFIQIGGSDQWGNIISGINLIRQKLEENAFGLTINLLLDSAGRKFGKSTSEQKLFINPSKTSSFQLFQHFINVEDNEVEKLLKFFTFLTIGEIKSIIKEHDKDRSKRIAQKILAKEIVRMLHGENGLNEAIEVTEAFFGKNEIWNLSQEILEKIFVDFPNKVKVDQEIQVIEALVESGLTSSKNEARKLIKNNGIKINGDLVTNIGEIISTKRIHILQKGKKTQALIQIQ